MRRRRRSRKANNTYK